MFSTMIMRPAVASQRANLLAPSIETVEVGFGAHFVAARAGFVLGDEAGIQVGVDGPSACRAWRPRVNRAVTSEMRPAPLVTTTKLMMVRIDEHHHADGIVAADHELAE